MPRIGLARSEGNHVAGTNRDELRQTWEFEPQLAGEFSFAGHAGGSTPTRGEITVRSIARNAWPNRGTGTDSVHVASPEGLRGRSGRGVCAAAEALRKRAPAGAERERSNSKTDAPRVHPRKVSRHRGEAAAREPGDGCDDGHHCRIPRRERGGFRGDAFAGARG